jgi:hypothetical protein
MNDPKNGAPKDRVPDSRIETDDSCDPHRSGRVGFDERGNSVWEWQIETGVYGRDISTQRLKRLTPVELSLVDTGIHERPDPLADKQRALGGFNPYDSASSATVRRSPQDYLSLQDQQPAEPRKRRTLDDMRKLSEAIKLKKKLEQNR